MAFQSGRSIEQMKALKALADKLAPGRAVNRIVLDFPVRGILTATITVLLEDSDLETVDKCIEVCGPDVVGKVGVDIHVGSDQ